MLVYHDYNPFYDRCPGMGHIADRTSPHLPMLILPYSSVSDYRLIEYKYLVIFSDDAKIND
jgi:hypothetical protein